MAEGFRVRRAPSVVRGAKLSRFRDMFAPLEEQTHVDEWEGMRGSRWELPRSSVTLAGELGVGQFGKVYEGTAALPGVRGAAVRVAVKELVVGPDADDDEHAEMEAAFAREAKVMVGLASEGGQGVVQLLGLVTQSRPPLMVMELMPRGDLKTVLRAARCARSSWGGGVPGRPARRAGRSAPAGRRCRGARLCRWCGTWRAACGSSAGCGWCTATWRPATCW